MIISEEWDKVGGGVKTQFITHTMPSGSSYETITLDFEPKAIVMWTNDNYSGFYTSDDNCPYEVFLSQNSTVVHYDLPRTRAQYYCEIKDINGKNVEVWQYAAYTLNMIAYG